MHKLMEYVPWVRVPLGLGKKETMEYAGDGGGRCIRTESFATHHPRQDLLQPSTVGIQAEYSDRDRDRGNPGTHS